MRQAPIPAPRLAERGQAIVEFALIVPILFLMIVGVVFFAMAFNLQQVLNNAAYEGARVWAKNPGAYSSHQCSLPRCDPNGIALNQNNFQQYLMPLVRQYVTNNGYNGNLVIFYSYQGTAQDDAGFRAAVNTIDQNPELVTVTIYYPYTLPLGNLAGNYTTIMLSASCTFKRG